MTMKQGRDTRISELEHRETCHINATSTFRIQPVKWEDLPSRPATFPGTTSSGGMSPPPGMNPSPANP